MTDPAPAPAENPSFDHHPAWAGVGKSVRVVRRPLKRSGDHVVEEHTATVVRHTASTIVLDSGEKFRRGHPADPVYRLSPRGASGRTTLEALASAQG